MRLIVLSLALACIPSVCLADLIITLNEVAGNGVEVSWSGSGTIVGSGVTGNQLDFAAFGSAYGANIDGTKSGSKFALVTPLSLSGTDFDMSAPYSNAYGNTRLDNDPTDGFDLLGVAGTTSLAISDTYSASGSSFVTGLSFSDLVPGSYVSASGAESTRFGGVTLNINAVPEPSAFLFGGLVCGVLGVSNVRKRKRSEA